MSQKGQKYGWTYGGLGAFIWLLVLSIVLVFQKNFHGSFFAIVFFALGVAYLIEYAPWKYPDTPFWKIYLGLVILLIFSASVMICLWDKVPIIVPSRFITLVYLLPTLTPIFILGKKTWNDLK